jgi:hypothetical protein
MALDILTGAGMPAKIDTDLSVDGAHTPRHKVVELPGNVEGDIAASKGYLQQLIGAIVSGRMQVQFPYVELTLTAQAGTSDWQSEWVDARPWNTLLLLLSWTAVVGTTGTLGLEATVDPAKSASNVHDISSVVATYYGKWPAVSSVAGAVTIPLATIFPYVRWKYTAQAGGGPSQFTPFVFGRGI